jgi:hypothetical protein
MVLTLAPESLLTITGIRTLVAATFEKANTYVYAGRLIRNAEAATEMSSRLFTFNRDFQSSDMREDEEVIVVIPGRATESPPWSMELTTDVANFNDYDGDGIFS